MVTPEKIGDAIDELQIKLNGLNTPLNELYYIITDLNLDDVKKEYLHSHGNLTCIYQRLKEIKPILSGLETYCFKNNINKLPTSIPLDNINEDLDRLNFFLFEK